MRSGILSCAILSVFLMAAAGSAQTRKSAVHRPVRSRANSASVYPIHEGYVDAHGIMIYYEMIGRGAPLLILHGGPGASHDYFLPYLLPLARHNQLVFIDERGSGRSQKLGDPAGYTVDNMIEDVEDVREASSR